MLLSKSVVYGMAVLAQFLALFGVFLALFWRSSGAVRQTAPLWR
jgi:hypothetical protein